MISKTPVLNDRQLSGASARPDLQRITYRPLVDSATWHAFSRETNDCTVSALAISARVSYGASYAFWAWKGRRPQHGVYVPRHLPTLVRRYGRLPVRLSPVPFRPRSLMLGTFLSRYPEGRYFVLLCCHAVAVADGCAFDWNETTKRIVIGAWRVSDSPKNNAK